MLKKNLHIISLLLFLLSQGIVFGQELSTLNIVISDVQLDLNGADIIAGEAYINPLMYSFTATAKLGTLDKEFKFSDILWNIRYKKQIKLI